MTTKEIIAMLQNQHKDDQLTKRDLWETVRKLLEHINQVTENCQPEKRLRKGMRRSNGTSAISCSLLR